MSEQGKEPIKIGFVGAGFIGQTVYISKFSKTPFCEMAAIADSRPELRWKVAQKYGLKKAYSNHQEMLEDADIDAVVIGFRDSRSAPVVLDSLSAGKHVLCSPPMTHSLDQAHKLVKLAQRKNLVYSVAYSKRYDENILKARKMISDFEDSRELGKIVYFKAHCFTDNFRRKEDYIYTDEEISFQPGLNWPAAPDWLPGEFHEDFSRYLTNYCEVVNIMRFFMELEPNVKYADIENPCAQVVSLRFGKVPGIIETGTYDCKNWDEFYEIYFEKGRILIKTNPPFANFPAEVILYKDGSENKMKSVSLEASCALTAQAESFVNDVMNGRPSISSGSDSVSDMKAVEKIWLKQFNKKN